MMAPSHPPLPSPRGPLSEAVLGALAGPPGSFQAPPVHAADPLADDDLHLTLYACYELHYRSFAGVDSGWEWEPSLLCLRRALEQEFLDAVALRVPARTGVRPGEVGALLFQLAESDPAPSPSRYLERHGTVERFQELLVHRSAYQLKEADPHTWAIPRLEGAAKVAMVEIQADEYGSGSPERAHSTLFAKAMEALGLEGAYGAYLDDIPGFTLATVNLITAFGLNRRWRGALVGHLAMFEITSPLPNARFATALQALGFDGDALEFFAEHVEADSVHENIAAYDMAQGLALHEPDLTAQIVLGAEAMLALDGALGAHLIEAWEEGVSSLRRAPLARAA